MEKVTIKNIRKLNLTGQVYDLSVEGTHNFFIGKTQTLTHNCDYITPQAQAALRNLMEVFSKTTRFILTANYKDRIISPIQSRCQMFEIVPPSRKEAAIYASGVLKKENIEFTLKDLALIVDAHYPDLRQIINDCQNHTTDGTLSVEARQIAESDYKTHLITVLKGSADPKTKFKEIRQILADAKVRDYAPLYRLLYDRVDEICPNKIAPAILAIAEGQHKDALVVDHEINAMATLINVLNQT